MRCSKVTAMQTDITFSFAQLIWLIGGCTALYGFGKLIAKPFKELANHERRITTLEHNESERKATDRYTTKALNAIVNHMIDGNGIDKLREVRDEYQEEIINHHI